MINTAEVMLWGTRVGIIHIEDGRDHLSFEYDHDFLSSGIELSPIRMPLSSRIYEFPELAGDAFHGAPGLIADSLPDKFGNKVIERWLLEQGKNLSDFNVIDRLCYTGSRGMGALEFRPATGPEKSISEFIDIKKMVEFASDVLANRFEQSMNSRNELGYSQLVQLGTSAGGARAKAIIAMNETTNEIRSGQIDAGKGFDYWLIKFDGVTGNGDHDLADRVEYTKIEYAYSKMAKDSGIIMSECRLLEDHGCFHFMTKRFDRQNGQKIHMQTLGALSHIDYNIPGLCSYEQAAVYMRQIGITYKEIEQFYRRMVFNVLFVNHDDHVKNISFLMSKNGEWTLAPAYDLTFSYNLDNRWLKAHQMLINAKNTGITKEDLISAGRTMGITKRKCDTVINEVKSIRDKYTDYLSAERIKDSTIDTLHRIVMEKLPTV